VKLRPVGDKLFHEDGRTYMKLLGTFRNFANGPKFISIQLARYAINTELTWWNQRNNKTGICTPI